MAIDKILTHSDDAVSRLLEQYKGKPLIEGRLRAFVDQIQDLETGTCTLVGRLDIAAAEGVLLDGIGAIVGEPRNGRSDDDYRTAIYARIGINTSRGLAEDIISLWLLTLDPVPSWVFVQNLGDGNINIVSDYIFSSQDEINTQIGVISAAIAGGVRLQRIICADTDEAFCLGGSGDGAIPPNPNVSCLGFDDGSATVGGELATSYEVVYPFAFEDGLTSTAGFGAGSLDPVVGGALVTS